MVKTAVKYKQKIFTFLSASHLMQGYKGIEFISVSLPHQGVCVQDAARDQVLFIPCENISYIEYEGSSVPVAPKGKTGVTLKLD